MPVMDGRGPQRAQPAQIVIRPEDLRGGSASADQRRPILEPPCASRPPGCCVPMSPSCGSLAPTASCWRRRPRRDGSRARCRDRHAGHRDRSDAGARTAVPAAGRCSSSRAARAPDGRSAARPLAPRGRRGGRDEPGEPVAARSPGRARDRARGPAPRSCAARPRPIRSPASPTAAAWPARSSATWRPRGAASGASPWPCWTSIISRPSTTPRAIRRRSAAARRGAGVEGAPARGRPAGALWRRGVRRRPARGRRRRRRHARDRARARLDARGDRLGRRGDLGRL